jgi:hypothetical protein
MSQTALLAPTPMSRAAPVSWLQAQAAEVDARRANETTKVKDYLFMKTSSDSV